MATVLMLQSSSLIPKLHSQTSFPSLIPKLHVTTSQLSESKANPTVIRVIVLRGLIHGCIAWWLLQEAQKLMDELNESWEDKLKKTQAIQKERQVTFICVCVCMLQGVV